MFVAHDAGFQIEIHWLKDYMYTNIVYILWYYAVGPLSKALFLGVVR